MKVGINHNMASFHQKIYSFPKIFFDLLFSIFILPIFLLILPVFYILISLDSRGSTFFIQDRVGSRGKIFKCFKFRTMKINTPNISTEEMERLGLKPITRVGYWLRKTSLDELPQILNVLFGQMSIIGPRPALPSQNSVLKMRRDYAIDNLRPGITGLAQVRGRDSLNDIEKVNFDKQYYDNFSIGQDICILYETINTIISNKGNK